MARSDLPFELKLGRIGRDDAMSLSRVRASVRQASRIIGVKGKVASSGGVRAHFRKGSAGKSRPMMASQRRVVVKARYAMHGAGKGAPLKAHVRYLSREGRAQAKAEPGLERAVDYLQRDDKPGQERLAFYDAAGEGVDGKAVTQGWAEDRLHFRLIISAEDGGALGNLQPMIREVMADLETKLGTKLEWLAVDHWDTDNPHTHVLVRGVRADGQDLFIPSRILSHGIREHAQEVVTRVLGPRLQIDIARDRLKEIGLMAVTQLDRQLVASQDGQGIISVYCPDLIARLERLETWGLADRSRAGWRIADGLMESLKAMQQHREVEQAVSGHLSEGQRLPVLAADRRQALEGRLVHLGSADDLGDGFLAVIETGHGELRYARFERDQDLAMLEGAIPGAEVAFAPVIPEVKPSDKAIAAIADRTGGLYSMEEHLAESPTTSRGLIEANLRRLEAMRRMSLVARREDGAFIVGHDHLKRAMVYEERIARRYPLMGQVLSYWTLDEQITALGPTRLDRVLSGEDAPPGGKGAFARQHADALQQRRLFLVEQGWLTPDETLSRHHLTRMAEREIRGLATDLSAEIGKPFSASATGEIRGIYARRIDLAQGRVALIVGEHRAHIVPWRPALERFAGREVVGAMRGQGLSWGLAMT